MSIRVPIAQGTGKMAKKFKFLSGKNTGNLKIVQVIGKTPGITYAQVVDSWVLTINDIAIFTVK